jgi:hypothetical protein
MNETACMYTGNREEALVAYLYDDIAPADRRSFEAHLAICEVCREELSGFGAVRARLGAWAPPEPSRALTPSALPTVSGGGRGGVLAALHEVPVWAQAVAAMLFLGLAAGAANLHINYTADGFSIRTGWLSPAAAEATQSAVQSSSSVTAPSVDVVSKSELAAELSEVRADIGAARAADADFLRQVRGLIAESEGKQQNELALRLAVLLQDVQSQRAADVTRVNRVLAQFSWATDMAIRRQEQKTDTISTQLLRVSTQK